jgi:hypothetical protein
MARRIRAHGTAVSPYVWLELRLQYRLTQHRYKHRLTKRRENVRVSECLGGLLADEMGMGKSLSVLTLIVHTLEAAKRFEARRLDDSGEVPMRQSSGATVIAAPKSSTCEALPFTPFKNANAPQLCRAGSLRLQGIDLCQSSYLGIC